MKTRGLITDHGIPSSGSTPPFSFKNITLDAELAGDECLIELKASGICPEHDFAFTRQPSSSSQNGSKSGAMQNGDAEGTFPIVLGHEAAGLVREVGSEVTGFHAQDRVVLVYASCGSCKYCQRSQTSYCDYFYQLNFSGERKQFARRESSSHYRSGKDNHLTSHFFGISAFANHVVVKQSSLVRIPDDYADVPWKVLAAMGCSAISGAGATLHTLPAASFEFDSIVIVGASTIGLASLMAMKLGTPHMKKKKIIVVDSSSNRLSLARSLGATYGVNTTGRESIWQVLLHITDGQGVDACIDTTGDPKVVECLVHCTARKGKIISVGMGNEV